MAVQHRMKGRLSSYKSSAEHWIILGEDGEDYLAGMMDFTAVALPKPGMAVTFQAVPSDGSKRLRAQDIRFDPLKIDGMGKPKNMRTTILERHGLLDDGADNLHQAARDALRLRRERQAGLIEPKPEDDLPPGTRVYHRFRGHGVVILSASEVVSVRLDNDPTRVVELSRSTIVKEGGMGKLPGLTPAQITLQEGPALMADNLLRSGTSLARYIRQLESDVMQKLTQEGLGAGAVYHFESSAAPSTPPHVLPLDPRVADAFRVKQGICEFYSHQAAAYQALRDGKNIIIATPTASGKTEAYNPAILEGLLGDGDATALYLFPLVALGYDQADRLQKLILGLPEKDKIPISILNNTVLREQKSQTLRADNRILITTPEYLHYILLPKPHSNWKKYFRNLRYVVVDEAHVYRGVFGANMANILRRLLMRCRREGNPRFPQVIISSATIRAPASLASQLTGLDEGTFEIITENGSPTPDRHFLATRTDIHELDVLCSDLLDVTTTDIGSRKPRPVSTIVFLRSINEVKQSCLKLREHLRRSGKSDQARLVEEFYADRSDKKDILVRLKKSEIENPIRCLFTTTALMAGIDIGTLDVAIVKNFPGLVMDARQMFGRAGRAREGAVIFLANCLDPFDQFYFDNPELLFHSKLKEDVVASPENPLLLAAHLQCAAQVNGQYNCEGPLAGEWVNLFGQTGHDLLDGLVKLGNLSILAGSYRLNSSDDPHDSSPLDNIRSMNRETYIVQDLNGHELERKGIVTAHRDAHRDAIIWVSGQTYKVVHFDDSAHTIHCEPFSERNLRTQGVETKTVEILTVDSKFPLESSPSSGIMMENGEIKITTNVNSYLLYRNRMVMQCRNRYCRYETPNMNTIRCPQCMSTMRPRNHEEVEDEYAIPTPPVLQRDLQTRSTWLEFPLALQVQYNREFWPRWCDMENERTRPKTKPLNFEFAVHSLEHAILKAMPEIIRSDPDEIAGVYEMDLEGLAGRLFIYDNFPGGLGLADEIRFQIRPILEGALDLIERCTCLEDDGCPVCLSYFGCRRYHQSLSKLAGRYLLRSLLENDNQIVLNDLREYVNLHVPGSQRLDWEPEE
jgi:DEAD/DEAH box helicase domain-containing protein